MRHRAPRYRGVGERPRARAWCIGTVLTVLAAVIATAAAAPAGADFPITLTRGSRLLVQASINGRAVQALLDSAAEVTLIDARFASDLGLHGGQRVAGQGSGQAGFDAELIKGVTLGVFGVTLRDQEIAVADLGDVGTRLLGQRLDVILGREIFDAARLQIDIAGGRVRVMPRNSAPAGVRLELVSERGIETLPVTIEEHGPLRATFDLGNGSQVLIGATLAQRLHLLTDGRAVTQQRGGGLGGEGVRQVIQLRSLEVAGRTFTRVPAAIDAQPSAADVNLGISVLRHFLITTDFAAHQLWLEPRP